MIILNILDLRMNVSYAVRGDEMKALFELDHTHDAARKSWVHTANAADCEFPIQNLPLGIFVPEGQTARVGVAIGDQILDLLKAGELGLIPAEIDRSCLEADCLNDLLSRGHEPGLTLRHAVFYLLSDHDPLNARQYSRDILHSQDAVTMLRPVDVRNYTDFYAGIHHAVRAGTLLQPENPLPDNYKWVPIGYHGRPSTVKISGQNIKRPQGQLMPARPGIPPAFDRCRELDLELEMAVYVGKPSAWGEPIEIEKAFDHVAGFGLLNDWSARDIQKWEMKPLGPFLAKNFGTTISPWVITPYALAPFRQAVPPRPAGDPAPLPYLHSELDQRQGAFDIRLEVLLSTKKMREVGDEPVRIITSNMSHLYWTPQQMLTHHSISGCQMESGDILGTGTISGPTPDQLGSLLELTENGTNPVMLPNGEVRSYLEDDDQITLKGVCQKKGFATIGFGNCSGTIIA